MPTENQTSEADHRTAERQSLKVKAVVKIDGGDKGTWKEMCEISTVSRNGAALALSRECSVGRIMSMVLEMPHELRLYDLDKEVYPMLAVVQHCYRSTENEKPIFHVGVAFIGKKLPEAYKRDPLQCYRLTGMNAEGLWDVVEAATSFKARKHPRFWRRFELTVSVRDNEKRTTEKVEVLTREISAAGVSVWGDLDVNIGDRVKVSSRQHDFFAVAHVRNLTVDEKNPDKTLTHLEFEDAEFPVEMIHESKGKPKSGEDDPADPNEAKGSGSNDFSDFQVLR